MITKDMAESIIDSKLDITRLKRIIIDTSSVAWANQISEPKIDKWLNNFTGGFFRNVNCEHKLALWLLHNFTFYTEKDIRTLCRKLFNLILHEIIVGKNISIDEARMELVDESVFLGLGNASESGNNILFFFRQENNLPNRCFSGAKKKCKNLILIDDVSISGEQAIRYIDNIIKDPYSIKADKIYVCDLLVTDVAKDSLKKRFSDVSILAPIELDSRDKAFSIDSYAFSNTSFTEIKDYARDFCEHYGFESVKGMGGYIEKYPLGFADGQYLFGLSYNTPDNTLPIFWGKAVGWYPLFTRYHKNLGDGKEIAVDGRKYY